MTEAEEILLDANENMSIDEDDGYVVGVEDVDDSDDGIFRVAYYSTDDGGHAIAFCIDCPYENPYPYTTSHLRQDGFLCLGHGTTDIVEDSPFDLETVIERTRYWAIAFSHLLDTGEWVDP